MVMDLNFWVAATTARSRTKSIISNGTAPGVAELRRLIFLCTAHTIVSSFLISARSHILEVLCIRFLCDMLACWSNVLQILWQYYRYIGHSFPLIKGSPCPSFSQSLRPFPANISTKQLDILGNPSDFILNHATYLVFNLFDHEIILMHLANSPDLIPPAFNDDESALLNLRHHDVLEGCILLASDWLKHLLLILSVASSRWAREWVVGVLAWRDADREGQRTD